MALVNLAAYLESDDGEIADVAPDVDTKQNGDAANATMNTAADGSNEIEMLAARLSELCYYRNFVERSGINCTFLEVVNYNDQLSKLIGIRIPSCESFSAFDDPQGRLSKDVVAGLENVIKSIWEWIKKIALRVWNVIRDTISYLTSFFKDAEESLKKLTERIKQLPQGTHPTNGAEISGHKYETIKVMVRDYRRVESHVYTYSKDYFFGYSWAGNFINSHEPTIIQLNDYSREDMLQYVDELSKLFDNADKLKKNLEALQGNAKKQADNADKNARSADATNKEVADRAKMDAEELKVRNWNYKQAYSVLKYIIRLGMVVPRAWLRAAS